METTLMYVTTSFSEKRSEIKP